MQKAPSRKRSDGQQPRGSDQSGSTSQETFKTQISEIVSLLRQSKRPLFHIGQGARDASATFIGMVERHGFPFVTARNANDIVASTHPLYIGRPGTFAQRGANFAVQLCDLYIAVGTRLSLTQTGYNTKDYARNAQIIQVDIDQAELDKGTLRNPVKIRADAKEFLTELNGQLGAVKLPDWSIWVKRCQYLRNKYPIVLAEYKEQKEYVNSFYFIEALAGLSQAEDVIVTDMGFAFQNTHQVWKVKQGQRLITNCGLAPMGWGLPAAVGACIGSGRRTLCITGEGGLMFNIQELATVMHHQLPIKIFVLNNGGYLTIKQTQQLGFEGRLMGVNKDTGLSFPDFQGIAYAHGINWVRFDHNPDLTPLMTILEFNGPWLAEIMMSPDQIQAPRAVNRRNPDGTMNPTKLEDAFPFLPPEEVEEAMRIP